MPNRVNKFAMVGGLLCGFANSLALVSLVTPDWVVNDFYGCVKFGLTTLCHKPMKGDEVCVTPNLPGPWKVTLIFLILGVLSLTLTCFLIVASYWRPKMFDNSTWVAIVASMQLCLASIVFPIGFGSPEVGGTAFKLPQNNALGTSYVCFILATIFTVFGGVCMRKGHPIGI